MNYVAQCVVRWQQAGTPLNDIAVIYFSTEHGRMMAAQLKYKGIQYHLASGKKMKAAYDPSKPQVTIISGPSSKGLEFSTVVVIGIGHLGDANRDHATEAKLLYVAMTRAKEKLLLLASKEKEFTNRITSMAA